ncbi:putative RNA-binding protein [Yarrowia sp. B02]|nr:putative RNA-binding protein [Yarrowia sp. B02]
MPPKKQQQKMSLFEFNANEDWADDEVETSFDGGYDNSSYGGYSSNNANSSYGASQSSYDRPKRDYPEAPVPDVPPFLAKLVNLPYDITEESVTQFFGPGYDIKEVSLVMDRDTGKPRGSVNMEFGDKASLEKALTLSGQSFGGRPVRVFVSTPRDTRTERDWTRRGPLPPIEGESRADTRDWARRPAPPADLDGPRETRAAREAREDAENPRDFSNWSRRGPLPSNDNEQRKTRGMEFRERRSRQDDPENPRDFSNWERRGPSKGEAVLPEARERAPRPPRKERSPTRADQVDSWRGDAKPSGPGKTVNLSGGSLFGSAKPVDTTERLAAIEARKEKERQELLARKREDKPKAVKEDKTERTWERRGPLPPKGRDSKPKKDDKPKPKASFAALAVEGEDDEEAAPEEKPEEAKENVDLPAVEKLAVEDDGDWNVVSGKKRR